MSASMTRKPWQWDSQGHYAWQALTSNGIQGRRERVHHVYIQLTKIDNRRGSLKKGFGSVTQSGVNTRWVSWISERMKNIPTMYITETKFSNVKQCITTALAVDGNLGKHWQMLWPMTCRIQTRPCSYALCMIIVIRLLTYQHPKRLPL